MAATISTRVTWVWLDDQWDDPETPNRRPPSKYWTPCKTASEAIQLLKTGSVTRISFDHDLGDEETCGSGYDVAKYIEELVCLDRSFVEVPEWDVHSANPVGRQNIVMAMHSAERQLRMRQLHDE